MFNSIVLGFQNAISPKRPDWRIRAGGLLAGCSLCYLVYYFGIFWPIVRFGCWE